MVGEVWPSTQPGEDARNRLCLGEHLLDRRKGRELFRLVGYRPEAASPYHPEAAAAVLNLRHVPEVVHLDQAAGLLLAA